ncbi:hypothetical protein IWQ60_011458 [Tieghemiomyces parasiticus]|uniref:Cell division cycle protein 123 n=1 Tax=Tieghemiomyces parasiticus TaxID=78921 RepID=A0A9W7ZNY0_9FUNG|nr:hypothetical protein IWQ60_011458 [Tieghemiomyces parasiticus]
MVNITEPNLSIPTVTRRDIERCSFSNWYPQFRSHTIRSKVLKPIPTDLLTYLRQDGLVLPPTVEEVASEDEDGNSAADDSSSGQIEGDGSDDEEAGEVPAAPDLTEVVAELRRLIGELGGAVFPKLNWSAPRDATWIASTNTLRCTTPDEILLLLKSSDCVSDDLSRPYREAAHSIVSSPIGQGANRTGATETTISADTHEPLAEADTELVLRKWSNLNPALEFRAFVVRGQLRAVSQMDLNHYPFLTADEPVLRERIHSFMQHTVIPEFPVDTYAVDLYVLSDHSRVYIVDFNPLGADSDTILVDWDDLIGEPNTADGGGNGTDDTLIHLFPANADGLRFSTGRYSQNRFPVDLNASNYQQSLDTLMRTTHP